MVENVLYHCSWDQFSTTWSNAAEVAQWTAPNCSRPQPATHNCAKDGISNWLLVTPTIYRAAPLSATCIHNWARQLKSVVRGFGPGNFGTLDHLIAYAATQGKCQHIWEPRHFVKSYNYILQWKMYLIIIIRSLTNELFCNHPSFLQFCIIYYITPKYLEVIHEAKNTFKWIWSVIYI